MPAAWGALRCAVLPNRRGKNILAGRVCAVGRKAFAVMQLSDASWQTGWRALSAPLAKM
jgi:hypothetical protein